MPENELDIGACIPDGSPGYTPGTGFELINCPDCGRRCWLGPTIKSKAAAGECRIVCAICAIMLGRSSYQRANPAGDSQMDEAAMQAGLAAMSVDEVMSLGRNARTNVKVPKLVLRDGEETFGTGIPSDINGKLLAIKPNGQPIVVLRNETDKFVLLFSDFVLLKEHMEHLGVLQWEMATIEDAKTFIAQTVGLGIRIALDPHDRGDGGLAWTEIRPLPEQTGPTR